MKTQNPIASICFLLLLALISFPQAAQQQQQLVAPANSVDDTHQLLIDQLYRLTSLAGNFSSVGQQQQHAGNNSSSNNNKTLKATPLLAPSIAQLLAAAAAASSVTAAPVRRQLNSTSTNHNNWNRSPVVATNPIVQIQKSSADYISATNVSRTGASARSTSVTGQQQQQQQQVIDSLLAVRQRWRIMESSLGESMGSLAHRLRSTFEELMKQQVGKQQQQQQQVSNQCSESIFSLLDAFATQKLWASQTIDANAKLPSGMLEGTLTELGNFDQCLAVQDSKGIQSNQYCSIVIKPPLLARTRLHTICQRIPALSASASLASTLGNLHNSTNARVFRLLSQNSHHFYYTGLRLGLCLPASCSRQDLQLLFTGYLSKFELLVQVKSCQLAVEQQKRQLDGLDLVQQCIVSTFLGLLILSGVGTFVDFLTSPEKPTITSLQNQATSRQLTNLKGAAACSNDRPPQAAAKRWHYQVYQNSKLAGHKVMSCQHHHQLPGVQRNPLLAGYQSTSYDNCNLPISPSISSTSLLSNQPTEKSTPESGQQHIQPQLNANVHNLNESWMNEFERAQQRLKLQASRDKKLAISPRVDYFKYKQASDSSSKLPSKLIDFLCCFSVKRNLQIIGKHATKNITNLSTNQLLDGGDHQKIADIEVIHGLRTITMIWIIFGHTVGLVSPDMMNNLFSMAQLSCSSRFLQALLNTTLAVNTFFMISGLVTAISFARNCESISSLVLDTSNNNNKSKIMSDKTGKPRKAHDKDTELSERGGLDIDLSSFDSSCSINISPRSSSSSGNLSCSSSQECHHNHKSVASSVKKMHPQLHHCQMAKLGQKREIKGNTTNLLDSKILTIWPTDFKPIIWLLLRYLRLTPAYAATIGLAILLPALGSGPFWSETVAEWGPTCRENWWKNLLYVNNFVGTERLCLIHSWYLSNDFQFFIVTLVILSIFYISQKCACLIIITLIVASSATTYALTMLNNFPPTIVTTSPAVAERWTFIHSLYYKPWPHLPSYLIGLCTGYLLLMREKRPLQMSSTSRFFAWFLFLMLALALLNSIYPWNMGLQVDPTITSLHSSTYRSLWAACCAWMVFALATKPHSWFSKFMSWHGFQVTSRLTYCAYLVHPLIIYYHFGNLRERLDSSPYGQMHRFIGTLMLSYLFSLLISVFIESPSIQLQRLITSSLSFTSRQNFPASYCCACLSSASPAGKIMINDQLMMIKPEKSSPNCIQRAPGWGEGSSLTSTSSWTGTSSFGDQSCAALIRPPRHHPRNGTRHSSSQHQQLLETAGAVELLRKSHSDSARNQELQGMDEQAGMQPTSSSSELSQKEGPTAATAHDAEFQQKLAQAISRGFRIRSRLAATTNGAGNAALGKLSTSTAALSAVQLKKQQQPVDEVRRNFASTDNLSASELQSNIRATSVAKQTALRKVEFTTFFLPSQQHHNHNMTRSQHHHGGGEISSSSSSRGEFKQADLAAPARYL